MVFIRANADFATLGRLWPLTLVVALFSGCSESKAAPSPSPTPPAATVAAEVKGPSAKRKFIEEFFNETLEKRKVLVRYVKCPDDVDDHFTVKCAIETGQGQKLDAVCHGANATPDCRINAAFLEPKQVVSTIRKELGKKKGAPTGKVEIDCPDEIGALPVGAKFYCRATAGRRVTMVDVAVQDLDGKLSVDIKG